MNYMEPLFSQKPDLSSGYHQVRVHPGDVEKTVLRTHDGHYKFFIMP